MPRQIAQYTTGQAARSAVQRLLELGVDPADMTLLTHDETLQQELQDLRLNDPTQTFLTDDETALYGDALSEGRVLLLLSETAASSEAIRQALLPEDIDPAERVVHDDYLSATQRDHMGGGAPVDPDAVPDPLDYAQAKQRDHMPADGHESIGLIDWFKERWHETKHEFQERWDKLSDEDIDQIEGDRSKLRTHLTRHYNITDDEAEAELTDFLRQKDIAEGGLDEHLRQARTEQPTASPDEVPEDSTNYYVQRDLSDEAHDRLERDIEATEPIDRD
ncbi:MAG TPA: hypothetical protein GXZ74_02300 [Tissierellia bacterium]|nr:hypothetical protein [Tissierellia bacterium]